MTIYEPPVAEMRFAMDAIAGFDQIRQLPGYEACTPDLIDAVLREAARFGSEVLAPLNQAGDRQGCRFENGVARTPDGFAQAYARFVDGGWGGVPFDPRDGGQGLPNLVSTALFEIWSAANLAFALCPMLTQCAAKLLVAHGTPEQRSIFLPNLISGAWNGTMELTEPQAGSDLGHLGTVAIKEGDHYRITGQKIFITYGEHDLTENVIHMVLARLPGAPPGVKGISVFLVPKIMVAADGSLGERNDVRCLSLEQKLGIHGSPTAVMSYGEDGGAVGYLIGAENEGMTCMFAMMNNARQAVGLEGVAIAERAFQGARAYARQRVQGRSPNAADRAPVTIIHHADVRRMMLEMKASTEAVRGLAYYVAGCVDRAARHPEEEVRRQNAVRADLLTPVLKAWGTDVGIAVADTGIQVHGGAGYIEETGAAQFLRDARITAIYEGTNGIQARDLVGRKVAHDQGRAAAALSADMRPLIGTLAALGDGQGKAIGDRLHTALGALDQATAWLADTHGRDPEQVAAGAVHYLRLTGIVTGGWLMARAALAAGARLKLANPDRQFLEGKIATARFFADHLLTRAETLRTLFMEGAAAVLGPSPEDI